MIHSLFLTRRALAALALITTMATGSAALACPDWSQTGTQLSYTSDQLWVPQSHDVSAGGDINLSDCPQPGVGFVAARPGFDLNFSENSVGRDLEVRVTARCDSVLLVNDAAGRWHFDDDGGEGTNSTLRIANAPEGAYDIWVGTYGEASCSASMTLETFNSSDTGGTGVTPPATATCPNPGLNGQMVTYEGSALAMSEQRLNVIAGGNIDLGACSQVPGHGTIIEGPDFTMNLMISGQSVYDLDLSTTGADCDTVLLAQDAAGQWYYNDDDGGDLTSRLSIPSVAAGEIDIWVGTFGAATCQTTLVSRALDVTPMGQPVGGGGRVEMLPSSGNLSTLQSREGETIRFEVTGADSGSVWGSGIYTNDSLVGRAAVHAGLLQVGETAVLDIVIMPGQQTYTGSTSFGVQSMDYGRWGGSFSFLMPTPDMPHGDPAPTPPSPSK